MYVLLVGVLWRNRTDRIHTYTFISIFYLSTIYPVSESWVEHGQEMGKVVKAGSGEKDRR